jgi:hypothetical protein
MRKIKAAVNPILIFGSSVTALFFCDSLSAGKTAAYVMAEYSAGNYRIIQKQNETMAAPVGSLLKPFAAWYLLERGINPQETIFCPPEKKRTDTLRCWTPSGHGAVSLQAALAQSCNYYFLSRFMGLNLAEYETWLRQRFDWPTDLAIAKPSHVYGYDLAAGIEPETLLAMYTRLFNADENGNTSARSIMAGLKETCHGTLTDFCKKLDRHRQFRFLAGKTGTVQEGKRNYGIAMLYLEHLPDRRKIILLCYEKNKMGAEAALNALKVLNGYNRKENR